MKMHPTHLQSNNGAKFFMKIDILYRYTRNPTSRASKHESSGVWAYLRLLGSFLSEVVAQIWLDPLRGFWGCWETLIKYVLFLINHLFHAFFGLRGVFLVSNSLHEVGGQKWPCPCYRARHLQQSPWKHFFYRMYGLGVMLVSSRPKLHLSIPIVV